MSFLNPVNEPVLRFKSTDAGAPQINYAARTAGDVKAVLKACLVTGYGSVASAGWSIVNEVDHVCEFVSPSAAMSDYRLGINDSAATKTDWYYQYQDARVNPPRNAPTKTFTRINASHADNSWTLLATALGFYFIEHVYSTDVSKLSSRITYFGQIKLAIASNSNLCFFNIGHNSQIGAIYNFFSARDGAHYHIAAGNVVPTTIATHDKYGANLNSQRQDSLIDVISPIFALQTDVRIVGQHPGLMSRIDGYISQMFGVSDIDVGGKPTLKIAAGNEANSSYMVWQGQGFNIALDFWEY